MTTGDADVPMDPGAPAAATPGAREAVAVSHGEALRAAGLGGALFAQWGREKRRRALQQRYGEEAAVLLDDGDTAFQYGPID